MNNLTKINEKPFAARRWEFLWLCGLILSFAYERPLAYLTPYDRTNPRLFDVMVVIGLLIVLPRLKRRVKLPKPLKIWAILVAWFCFCAVIWAVVLPPSYGRYPIYFALKYVEGLLALYIAISIPLNARRKQILHYVTVAGGVFVAAYCFPQYLSDVSSVEYLKGQIISLTEGTMLGPLGYGYYHLALFSGVSCILALALIPSARSLGARVLVVAIALFVAWPAFFSGSRTGPFFLGIAIPLFILFNRRAKTRLLVLGALVGVTIAVFVPNIIDRVMTESSTFHRLKSFEDTYYSVESRLMMFKNFRIEGYTYSKALPFVGAGFYVAPVGEKGLARYRVGYGFHNAYLFAFEQGGAIAFILFILFLRSVWRYLQIGRHFNDGKEQDFSCAIFAIFIVILFVGFVGLGFWYGSTMNLYIYLLLLYLLAGPSSGKVARSGSPSVLTSAIPYVTSTRK